MARTFFIPSYGAVIEDGEEDYFVPSYGVLIEDNAAVAAVAGPGVYHTYHGKSVGRQSVSKKSFTVGRFAVSDPSDFDA